MRQLNSVWILGLVCLSLAGCAGNDKKQEQPMNASAWLTQVTKKYPQQQYLIGHGAGESLALAKQRARVELAKVFAVRVSETSTDRQLVTEVAGAQSMESKAERYIDTRTDEVLQGVRVAETWLDESQSTYHALVVLNRFTASENLKKDIRALDEETAEHTQKARNSGDMLRTAAAAYSAYQAQVKRTALQNKLRVIDPSGQGIPAPLSLAKFRSDFEEVVGRIRVMAKSEDDKLQGALSAGLSKAGFNADLSKSPHYILNGSLDRTPISKRSGFYWLHGAVDLQLQDYLMGSRVVGTERWDFKISATDENLVEKRLYDKIQQLNEKNMLDTILGFAIADYQGQ
jgi:hypothetical protein